jgi:hypothetical protein
VNPLKPVNPKAFRAAATALRNFAELRPYKEWLEQRRAAYANELIRCTNAADIPRLQGRVCELDDQLAEIGNTEDPS